LFSKTSAVPGVGEPFMVQRISPTTRTVFKMAKVRKLVTSLTRLLSTKADLIGQIRKRLVTRGEWSLNGDPELYIHMGDILDHILSLQQALAHYERMLAQSHPIYLTQLDIQAIKTKAGRGRAAVILSALSAGIYVELTPIGLFSVNVQLPMNGHGPQYPYYMFGAVLAIEVVLTIAYLLVVRWIWRDAKKQARKSAF